MIVRLKAGKKADEIATDTTFQFYDSPIKSKNIFRQEFKK